MYDFDRTFAFELEKKIHLKLKKWAGIYQKVDNGLLFRSKENFGLGITSLTDHFERMQLIKCELLQSSVDLTVQKLYNVRAETNEKLVSNQGNCTCNVT